VEIIIIHSVIVQSLKLKENGNYLCSNFFNIATLCLDSLMELKIYVFILFVKEFEFGHHFFV